ncbi:MAG: hypothetical protein R3D57_15935 [Hyphomicrobiaceae bacterium]
MLQPQQQIEPHHGASHETAEQPLETTLRGTYCAGELWHTQRLGKVCLHQANGRANVRMDLAHEATKRPPLRCRGVPYRMVQDPIGDLVGELRAMDLADKVQHQVNSSRSTGRGHHGVIEREELLARIDLRITLGEAGETRPVRRRQVIREQPRFRQQVGAKIQRCDSRSRPALLSEPPRQLARPMMLRSPAPTGDDKIQRPTTTGQRLGIDIEAVACGNSPTPLRDEAPSVQSLWIKVVGNPEGLQGRRQSHHIEAGNDRERHFEWSPSSPLLSCRHAVPRYR